MKFDSVLSIFEFFVDPILKSDNYLVNFCLVYYTKNPVLPHDFRRKKDTREYAQLRKDCTFAPLSQA